MKAITVKVLATATSAVTLLSLLASCAAQGPAGAQGPMGANGKDGSSAYELAVKNGFEGTEEEWIASLVGQQGVQGMQGEKGEQGEQGIQGEKGDTGEAGKSAFELYRDTYGYEGTEEEWLADLAAGNLMLYTVTFDLNGGNGSEDFKEQVSVYSGQYLSLTIPTREGYDFIGWYTGNTVNDGQVTGVTPINQSLNLIARWRIQKVTVTFIDYYGDVLDVQTVDYNSDVTAPSIPQHLNAEKLVFFKWDKKLTSVTEDITTTAIYRANTYSIKFRTDGGSSIDDISYYSGIIPERPADPAKTGFVFSGWFLEPTFLTAYNFDYALNVDTVLYAKMTLSGDHILITTADELKAISAAPDKSYVLGNDIDLMNEPWTPIENFKGVLDGNGYRIYNFSIIENNVNQYAGFVRTNNGTIQNIVFEGFTVNINRSGGDIKGYAAVVAGVNNGIISNVDLIMGSFTYSATPSSTNYKRSGYSYVGGITGQNKGTVHNCTNSITMDLTSKANNNGSDSDYYVWGYFYGGGIVGYNEATISNSCCNGIINVTGDTYSYKSKAGVYNYIGGITGENKATGTVEACGSNIKLTYTGIRNTTSRVTENVTLAGVAGNNYGSIQNSYGSGSIEASGTALTNIHIAGLVGYNYNGATVSLCCSDMSITSTMSDSVTYLGGLIGFNENGAAISKCYVNCELTSSLATNYGYVVGENEGGIIHCYYVSDMTIVIADAVVAPTNEEGTSEDSSYILTVEFHTKTLYWDDSIWNIIDGRMPTLK